MQLHTSTELHNKIEWLKKLAAQGYAFAQFELANHYYDDSSLWRLSSEYVFKDLTIEEKFSKAIDLYTNAANQGHIRAKRKLADCFDYSARLGCDGIAEVSKAAALKAYEGLAKEGDVEALFMIGSYYDKGFGVIQDKSKAFEYYNKAATLGYLKAQYTTGVCYYEGNGVSRDLYKAIEWLEIAVHEGDGPSIYKLGEIYYNYFTPENIDRAIYWFNKAIAYDNVKSEYMLGQCYEKLKDYETAIYWYIKSSDDNSERLDATDADYRLAICYELG